MGQNSLSRKKYDIKFAPIDLWESKQATLSLWGYPHGWATARICKDIPTEGDKITSWRKAEKTAWKTSDRHICIVWRDYVCTSRKYPTIRYFLIAKYEISRIKQYVRGNMVTRGNEKWLELARLCTLLHSSVVRTYFCIAWTQCTYNGYIVTVLARSVGSYLASAWHFMKS